MRFALSLFATLALASTTFAQDKSAFPRRMLFVHASDYLYLGPLTHAAPGGADRVRESANRLAASLRISTAKDNDQLFVLSDTLAADAHLPTKDVLAKALDAFCATTRTQDRIVIYFGVHAVEQDGKAFVVPLDGDPTAPETLLPVADVYAKLQGLKAAQKVVIWDVCRRNPERTRGRRDTAPMTAGLFKALTTPPEGVQVLVSCSPNEFALEYVTARGTAGPFAGSAYLDSLRQAADDLEAKAAPGDVIPTDAIHKAAVKAVAAVTKGQTPATAGISPKQPAALDPKEAPAKRFEFSSLSKDPPADVKAILDELMLPPLFDEGRELISRLPSGEAALKGYAADATVEAILRDPEKYPLRVATLRALRTMRDTWPLNGREQRAVGVIGSPVTDQTKKAVGTAQEKLALAVVRLELELEALIAVANKRAKETKRWQAHYDFTLAELRLRLVMLNEYNRALAHVKTETLPDLPAGMTGWRFVPSEKLEGRKDVRAMFEAASEGLAKLATEHKGTPWEVLAKRSLSAMPAARWEPVVMMKK